MHSFGTPIFVVVLVVSILGIIITGVLVITRVLQWYNAQEVGKLEEMFAGSIENLVEERERTKNLLERMLPESTALELQKTGRVRSERYNMVTVLFADIEGFTKISDQVNAEVLVNSLDRFFYDLDAIITPYNIQKIKTIGDAYMCAGGLPVRNRTNPIEMVLAALEMQRHMHRIYRDMRGLNNRWYVRIGINTGAVIAGSVGRDKLSYDIWGSAVNIASRMETSSERGRINISGATYFFISEFFDCTYRGRLPVKNRGEEDMYFVDRIKEELSADEEGMVPNAAFQTKLQLIRLNDVEEYVVSLLERNLPEDLYYHNVKHTIDVYTQVELLGRKENVSDEDLLLLRTAALFHDIGHIHDYAKHEAMGAKIASEVLPRFHYSKSQIDEIMTLIMATQMPVNPQNLRQKIICDADLDYLGRSDYIPVANALYNELHERDLVPDMKAWIDLQIKFIRQHQYFTESARDLRELSKQEQLRKLEEWRDDPTNLDKEIEKEFSHLS